MKLLLALIYLTSPLYAFEYAGKSLPPMTLSGDDGGKIDGTTWTLEESLAKKVVTVIFYVDPDERDKNEDISERLNKKDYPQDKVQYIGMINYEATWAPNFVLSAALKKKQKKYPKTLYLRDYKKVGVKTWKVKDDENDVIVLDPTGKVVYHKFGYVDQKEGDKLIGIIEELIK